MAIKNVYLIGIGGIGMSAIARYYAHDGKAVAGYDRIESPLTLQLEAEGIAVHYTDDCHAIPKKFLNNPADTLVIYTPAVPTDHSELSFFRNKKFKVIKRSEALGYLTQGKYVMAVAGTHGKTTTSTMVAWFNHIAGDGGSAFLGGISKNFKSNLVLGEGRRMAVEADEFDRSFLQLHPNTAVITSTDADHLDIYGTHEAVKEAFAAFAGQIKPGGVLVLNSKVDLNVRRRDIRIYRYSLDGPADFHAGNLKLNEGGCYTFDIVCPDRVIKNCTLGVPGIVNVENCIAAVSLLWVAGFDEEKLREAIAGFRGIKRRFDFYVNTPKAVYMDDYAHHPEELRASISSVRKMFPGRRITGIFQPHLYTRTRDFAKEFAGALSLLDELWLLPIYPAREEPIAGVASEMILKDVACDKRIVTKDELLDTVAATATDVLVTFGAGDIDRYCEPIAEIVKTRA